MDIFLIILVVMLALGVTDLIVGVSNDAVNFTNSAIGSRVATRRTIMIVASIGIFIGALTASGMMEVARKGIFNPDGFTLLELMQLFLAVMITDVILLDLYNTLGLPTSTTVSLVFEIFGAALVLAVWKSPSPGEAFNLINSAGALKIISGIVLSVVIAFFSGMVIQFIFRSLFTFDINRTLRYLGGLFGGIAFTSLLFFIFLNVLKSSSLLRPETSQYIMEHFGTIMLVTFIVFAAISQVLVLLKINILKYVVLSGTGALAMAFAGNDLVNFIGVPLASYSVYELIGQNKGNTAVLATALSGNVDTPGYLLYIAAAIMTVTLWFSKKAQTVTKTEVGLATQGETYEGFSANNIARGLVQIGLTLWESIKFLLPSFIKNFFARRYMMTPNQKNRLLLQEGHAFDLLRASVNIATASSLIMIGTLNKLPLSTTFVTFMVAMGTSLSDKAWGRDNAVFRVSGVLTVIGGWFMTAIIASLTSGFIVSFIHLVGFWSMLVLVPATIVLIYVMGKFHRRRQKDYDTRLEQLSFIKQNPVKALEKSVEAIADSMAKSYEVLNDLSRDLTSGKTKHINSTGKRLRKLSSFHKISINQIIQIANEHFSDRDLVSIHSLTSALNYVKHVIESINRIREQTIDRVTLYQIPLTKEEAEDIRAMRRFSQEMIDKIKEAIDKRSVKNDFALKKMNALTKIRMQIHNNQLKRLKHGHSKVKTSVSYLIIIDEMVEINANLIELYNSLTKVIPWLITKKKNKKK